MNDRKHLETLFKHATIRLLAHKYAYYVADAPYVSDATYDCEERSWHSMGMKLGVLTADETSPCVGFDEKHPLANKGKALAEMLLTPTPPNGNPRSTSSNKIR